MTRWIAPIVFVLALAGAVALAYVVGRKTFTQDRDNLTTSIATYTNVLSTVREERTKRAALDANLTDFADRTLGADLAGLDHRLRTHLNRVGEELGLSDLSVRTGAAAVKLSPAKTQFSRSASQRALRDEPDFTELEGWVSGKGDLRQVMQLIDRLQTEPWMKHITQLRLEPKDNGQRFDVALRLTTLFINGRAPRSVDKPVYDESGFARYASIIDLNPFRVPPPPAPVAEPPVAPVQAAAPASFPYGKWLLTGVAEGPAGPEAWIRNRESGETRRLGAGETLDQAIFVAARGDRAEFRVDQQRFQIVVGQSFEDRSPIEQ